MTVSKKRVADRRRDAVTPAEVLETFAAYQGQTAGMVAEKFDIECEGAALLLDELVARGSLTKARAHTVTPVWIRPHPQET